MIDQVISHYRIIKRLGAGGMGEVYLAEDTTLNRPVALKMLPHEHTQDEERLRRFRQEAKAASALNHPNILTIHEVGETRGRHFIATEFIDGDTLGARVGRTGAMDTAEVLEITVQIASALAAAHEVGIVHRDLKPDNIMLRRDGYVKVLDFGLAKLTESVVAQQGDAGAPTTTLAAHTATGLVVGTAQYMAPEQAAGKPVDARSDIFSFGAVIYEMVTGERAFHGDSPIATLAAVIHEEPKPLPAKVPPQLAKVILRCLRKDPARRFQTVADLKVALEDLREESRPSTHARRLPRWPRTGAAVLLIVLVGALLVWQPWRAPQNSEPLRAVALTTLPGAVGHPSLSPDGNQVVFTWTGMKQDNPDLYVQMIGTSGPPLRLTRDPFADYNPAWSPDGRWIAFLRAEQLPPTSGPAGKAELWLIPPLGGPERRLAEIQIRIIGSPGFLAWCPDSTCLVVTDSAGEGQPDALFVVSRETAEKRQLTRPPASLLGDCNPAVSPDGGWLVFRRVPAARAGALYALRLGPNLTAGGEPTRLTPARLDAAYPAWMPDGREILFSAAGSLWRLAIPAERSPGRLPFVGEDGLMPVVSQPHPYRPPRLVYVRSFSDLNIWRLETSDPGAAAVHPPVVAISSTRSDTVGDFSPDGRRVAFASGRTGSLEIWISDPDGSNAVQLTSIGATTAAPRWSPNGRLIAFQSNLEGQFDIYLIPAAGGKPQRLTDHPSNDHVPSFSRDGRWIYFGSNRSGDYQVWKVAASGGEAAQVTHTGGFLAFEGTDGADLYYSQAPGVTSTVWRVPVTGGQPVRVVEGVISSSFAVLERGIYYVDQPSDRARLQFFDFAAGRSTTVADTLGNSRVLLTASPDGRTILYTRLDSSVNDLMLVDSFR